MRMLESITYFKKNFIILLLVILLLPAGNAFATTTIHSGENGNLSTNGTIEVQALVQEGFIEPITVELSGKDDYSVKLLVTVDNGYVLRKQLPNGTYKVALVYTNTKAETDSQMWASSETLDIQQGKTTVLNVAVLDDSDGDALILFGEENNPFGAGMKENPADFMKENADKLSENAEQQESVIDNPTEPEKDSASIAEENTQADSDLENETQKTEKKNDAKTAFQKLIDLLVSLAKYILFSVFVMVGVSVLVWIYRRYKYGE